MGADTLIVEMNLSGEIGVVEVGEGLVGKALGEGGVAVGTGGDRAELCPLDSFGFRNISLLKIDVEGFNLLKIQKRHICQLRSASTPWQRRYMWDDYHARPPGIAWRLG